MTVVGFLVCLLAPKGSGQKLHGSCMLSMPCFLLRERDLI